MTQTYFPFDSGQGGSVTETQWQKMAQYWLNTGVIKSALNELQVYADSTGLQVKAKPGQAWIKGHFFESDTEEVLPIATADTANPRIDRVIVRVDWTANSIQLAVLQGVPAASPSAPALTQIIGSRWEISLAQVYVGANVSTIAAGNITDERNYVKNANYDQETWTALTLQNSWVAYGGGYANPAYRKNNFGEVELRGVVKSGVTTTGTVIATLPSGYRPPTSKSYAVASYDGTNNVVGRVSVGTDGTVMFYGGSNVFTSLDGVIIPTT